MNSAKSLIKFRASAFLKSNGTLFLIILVTILLYLRMFHNFFTNWDDDLYVLENPYIKNLSFQSIKQIFNIYYCGNYHPLTMLSLALDYYLGGLQPWPYQLTNLVLHIANILLVYTFIHRLLRVLNVEINIQWVAFFTAWLFAIHPFQVESVAWVSERKNVLYVFFFLLSLISYIDYLGRKKNWLYWISVFLFILSLLSKGQAITLSICVLAIDFSMNRKITALKVVIEKVPFILLSILFGLIAIKAQQSANAIHIAGNFSLADHCFLAGYGFIMYFIKLLYPFHLSAFYPYPEKTGLFLPYGIYIGFSFSVVVFFGIFWVLRQHKAAIFGWLFFIINLALVIQIIPVGDSIISDRYMYLPSVGVFMIAGFLLKKYLPVNKVSNAVFIVVLFIYSMVLCAKTYLQIEVWKDSYNLWSHSASIYPENNDRAWLSLGIISYHKGEYDKALKCYQRVLDMKNQPKRTFAQAFVNIGLVKKAQNKLSEAFMNYNLALANNTSYEGFYNRAKIQIEKGDTAAFLNDLDSATNIDPYAIDAYIDRGNYYFHLGKNNLALTEFEAVIHIDPEQPVALFRRGQIRQAAGDYSGALGDYNKANTLQPNYEFSLNRAFAKYSLGDYTGAIADLEQASNIDPKSYEVYFDLGLIKFEIGNLTGSIDAFNKAIMHKSTDSEVFVKRGIAFFQLKKYAEAKSDLNHSIELNPSSIAYYYLGMIYKEENNPDKACAYFKKAVEMGYSNAESEIQKNCR